MSAFSINFAVAMSERDSRLRGSSFSRTEKIDCLARMVAAKENNISERREGIAMNRVSISQDEASRSRKILQRCMKHRVLYVIAKMTYKRENLGEIYRRDGRRAKARRKDLSADIRERKARKFNGNTVVI